MRLSVDDGWLVVWSMRCWVEWLLCELLRVRCGKCFKVERLIWSVCGFFVSVNEFGNLNSFFLWK